jgi:hypothetical protein
MGSFNEVCALSGFTITPGDPVRLLFLTQNPYVKCDEREAQRGCYHYDQWFVRTPPIKGEYADYGRCDFKEGELTKLISDLFDDDVVERPFGFNQYHAGPVLKGRGIHQYIEAAWQGRLNVRDDGGASAPKVPDKFPTWQKIHQLLKDAKGRTKFPLQCEVENGEGYNASDVIPGVVCVNFNKYGDNSERLNKVKKLLDKTYESKLVYKKYGDRDPVDPVLIVTVPGAFDNPHILVVDDDNVTNNIKQALTVHPEMCRDRNRILPVLAVMIREDVWQTYCNLEYKPSYGSKIPSVESLFEKTTKTFEKTKEEMAVIASKLENVMESNPELAKAQQELKYLINQHRYDSSIREIFMEIPFQTMMIKHLAKATFDPNFENKEELARDCCELARIEMVMSWLHQSWSIPSTGGQEPSWKLRTKLLENLATLSKDIVQKQKEEWGDDEEEEIDTEDEDEGEED